MLFAFIVDVFELQRFDCIYIISNARGGSGYREGAL